MSMYVGYTPVDLNVLFSRRWSISTPFVSEGYVLSRAVDQCLSEAME